MLKTILVYWHSLVFIQKEILEKSRKLILDFCDLVKTERDGISQVKWQPIDKPKI